MGRFYSRHGRNLYIYLVKDDGVIDLDLFPDELNLFDTESAWRITEKMAIVNDADESNIDKAEIILSLNSYRRWDHPEEALERYFNLGDESVFGAAPVEAPEVAAEVSEEERRRPPEMEVIIPEVITPPTVSQIEASDRPREGVIIPPSTGQVETPTPSRVAPPIEKEEQLVHVPEKEVVRKPRPENEEELIERIIRYIKSRGFHYPDSLVKNYYACLKAKPFVILSGHSGLGKTALTRLFAEAVSDNVEEQYLRVPVPPNLLDDKHLTGYYNPLTERYVSTPFLDIVLKAVENSDKIYFVCLDDMNLSRPEYYFSRFLSALESLDRQLYLHGMRRNIETEDRRPVSGRLKMPRNLLITGTVDIDQSFHPLSPKLADCTNTIEFHEVDLQGPVSKFEFDREMGLDSITLEKFRRILRKDEEEKVINSLVELNSRTIKHNLPVTYRIRQEVLEYIANCGGIYSDDEEENLRIALDLQVKQRVLAKIAGTEHIRPLLNELLDYLRGRMPVSEEKARRMLRSLDIHGFTSFYF